MAISINFQQLNLKGINLNDLPPGFSDNAILHPKLQSMPYVLSVFKENYPKLQIHDDLDGIIIYQNHIVYNWELLNIDNIQNIKLYQINSIKDFSMLLLIICDQLFMCGFSRSVFSCVLAHLVGHWKKDEKLHYKCIKDNMSRKLKYYEKKPNASIKNTVFHFRQFLGNRYQMSETYITKSQQIMNYDLDLFNACLNDKLSVFKALEAIPKTKLNKLKENEPKKKIDKEKEKETKPKSIDKDLINVTRKFVQHIITESQLSNVSINEDSEIFSLHLEIRK